MVSVLSILTLLDFSGGGNGWSVRWLGSGASTNWRLGCPGVNNEGQRQDPATWMHVPQEIEQPSYVKDSDGLRFKDVFYILIDTFLRRIIHETECGGTCKVESTLRPYNFIIFCSP